MELYSALDIILVCVDAKIPEKNKTLSSKSLHNGKENNCDTLLSILYWGVKKVPWNH